MEADEPMGKIEGALFKTVVEWPILGLDKLVELGLPKDKRGSSEPARTGETVLRLEAPETHAEFSGPAINADVPRDAEPAVDKQPPVNYN